MSLLFPGVVPAAVEGGRSIAGREAEPVSGVDEGGTAEAVGLLQGGDGGSVGDARELLLGYVDALNAVDEAVKATMPSLERLADVLGLVHSRRISRSGQVGTYSYTVHGAGCRFVSDNGTEADVDFEADGSEIFDLWRLRWHGLSLPEALDVTDQDLRTAVRSLQPPLTEVRPGWFGVTD